MAAATFTLTTGDGFAARVGTTRDALAGARMIFKSNVKLGGVVSIDDGLEVVGDVVVLLDEDGKLNGDTGITLLADDESLNLSEPLEWQVTIKGARTQGFNRTITPFWFDAPESGASLALVDVAPPPGQTSNRGPAAYRIVSGSINEESGELELVNQDGSTVAITPGDSALLLVDNGDGTVSIA